MMGYSNYPIIVEVARTQKKWHDVGVRCWYIVVLLVTGCLASSACVVFDESLLKADTGTDAASDANADPDVEGDVSVDVLPDTPVDTPIDTPIDTPPDVPPPEPVCVSYDHDCNPGPSYFYPGEANQDCNEVCTAHNAGGYAGVPTKGIGSDRPSADRCTKVLQAMYQSSNTATTATHPLLGLGCVRHTNGTFTHYVAPTTVAGDQAPDVQRVCACQQNNSCQVISDGPCP